MWLFVTVALHAGGLNLADLFYFVACFDFCFLGWGYGGSGVISFFISAACYARFA